MKHLLSILSLAILLVLAVCQASAALLVLTWSDNSDNESGFTIERALVGGDFAPIANVPANTTRYVDEGLQGSTTYLYRVCAYNDHGASDWSNEASATTAPDGSPPAAPTAPGVEPEPPYQPPVIAMLAPGQSVLVIASAKPPSGS